MRRKPSLTNARGSITERLNMPTSAGTLAPQASTGGGDDDAYSGVTEADTGYSRARDVAVVLIYSAWWHLLLWQ